MIRAARLIDGTGAAPINNAIVIVTNDKITSLGSSGDIRVPSGARIIDLGDATLLPGFIDAHTHIVGRVLGDPDIENAPLRDYESFGAILGVGNARDTLMAGFTTVRNVGASGRFDDMALRKAINEGWIPGPRMLSAGHSLGVNKEFIEMIAMLALAATPVGRWAGLDFFIHNLLIRPCCSAKGK